MNMKRIVWLFLALMALDALFLAAGAPCADLSLDGPLSGIYATENGGVNANGTCVVSPGAGAVLVGDHFSFKEGFSVRSGGSLRVLFADYDHLDDAWELEHFGNLDQGPYDDGDGDGFTDYAESRVGTDPTNGLDYPMPGTHISHDASGRVEAIVTVE